MSTRASGIASMFAVRGWAWAGVNLVFAAFHPALALGLPSPARSLAVCVALLLLPAAGWTWLFGAATRSLGMRLALRIAISTGAFLLLIAVLRVAGVIPTQLIAWNAMWALTNAGFVAGALATRARPARRSLTPIELLLGGVVFVASFSLYHHGATRVVPPQVDHDLEMMGTGYGLLTRFEPLLVTDRQTVYYFAHPPLLHVYVAGSFLLHGAFPDLAFFDAASRRARDARAGMPAELELVTRRFLERPHLLETRAVSVFFASATVALLAIWTARISRRWWMGLLAAVAYATSPELFVRSSYGGYFALSSLLALLMLLAHERWRRHPEWRRSGLPIVIGALAGLSNHKLLLLPLAMVIEAVIARRRSALLHPVVVGFGLGTLVFWSFGLAIAPAAFLQDHALHHLLDRLTHTNPLGYSGYPGMLGLWREFLSHTAYVLLPAGLLLLMGDSGRAGRRRAERPAPDRRLWLTWAVVTGAVFTVVDWRMTKHLTPLLMAVHLGLVPDRGEPRWRTAVPALIFVGVCVWNVRVLGSLMSDFAGFTVTPGW